VRPPVRPTTSSAPWPRVSAETRSLWSAATAICCSSCPTTRSRSGCSIWAAGWRGRRARAGRGCRDLRRARGPRRTCLRRIGVAAGRSVRRAARCPRCRGEDRRDAAGTARLTRGDSGRRARSEIEDVQGVSDEVAGRHRLHRCRRPVVRVATDADVDFSTPSDTLHWRPSTLARSSNWPNSTASRRRSVRLQKALDALPG